MITHQNRDLSWLGFNFRVLQEASDKTVPLFERMKFLAIFSSNLDEFFRVRYPAVLAFSQLKKKERKKASIEATKDIAELIQFEINSQLTYFGSLLRQEIIPELKKNGIIFYYNSPIRSAHRTEINEIFITNVLAFIQPILLEANSSRPFKPENNQLYFVVTLKEPGHAVLKQAIVNIPSNKLKRFYTLSAVNGFEYVIFLDDIIRENLQFLFPKLEILSVYSIKFNRNASLHLSDDYSGNLLTSIESLLKKRDKGQPSRFLYEQGMPLNLQMYLTTAFGLQYEDLFVGGRYHNLKDLFSFPKFGKTELEYPKFKPLAAAGLLQNRDVFNVMEKTNIMLHLPYQSYNPVLSFFNQAAIDTDVTDIFITLYRVASESHIINALISAAKNGKNVTAFIELKARFDEANNIRWSRVMKEAGIKLVYSLPTIKVHSKTALVQKRRLDKPRSYAIISTGNFNEETALFYTDHVMMTCKPQITKELITLFSFLLKSSTLKPESGIKFKELLVAQFNLVPELERLVEKEIKKAKRGLPARIRLKVNNLEEPGIIQTLYKASAAGVKVDMIVRSICCLVPGVPGVSENITVRRIVDRFLEHSRLFIFGNGNNAVVIMGSADLMKRNLRHRIEVCIPVKDRVSKTQLIDYFDIQWSDTAKAVELLPEYQYKSLRPATGKGHNAQNEIYNYLKGKAQQGI